MSHTPTKKSVFDRIGSSGAGMSSASSSSASTGTTNVSTKSTHGFCSAYIKNGTCPLGDTCKYIHEQPNVEKPQGPKDELRITKTVTRVVDMSSPSIKSTVTVSNEQRPVVITNSTQSTRTVVESVNAPSTEHSDRRSSGSDRKQSQSRRSDSKSKSSSKKTSQSSSHDDRHSSNKRTRLNDSDSSPSSPSDSEYSHSSRKHKKKSDSHSTSSKHRRHDSLSPAHHNDEETLNDQLIRQSQTYNKSPKRTIVITERKKDETKTNKDTKSKSNPDIEFLGSQKVNRDKKSTETIHQQAESTKKSIEIKREKKSPSKSSTSDSQKHHSSSMNLNIQIKTEDVKSHSNKTPSSSERYERSDRTISQSTPPIVQLSPTPDLTEKVSITVSNDPEKSTPVQASSPVCVILDDDSIPSPSVERKPFQQSSSSSAKKPNDNEKNSSKQSKRSRDVDKSSTKDKTSEHIDTKRKRLSDGSSKKIPSSSKNENDGRSTNNRSESRRGGNISSRDESSSGKYKEKSEFKTNRNNDSKDRNANVSSSKPRNNSDRRDTTRSTPDKKRSTYRHGKGKGLENVTDSEEHLDEPILPKQSAIEAYMSMDWSSLSRDKRIPLNAQITSRIARNDNNKNLMSVCERLLTDEEKEKLHGLEYQSSPLTHFMNELQQKSTLEIVNSCHRRFGSCAKDMIDMRHKWFIRSIEPVEKYQFINKEHYIAYQQALNSLSDQTSNDVPTVPIETTTADVLLS